MDSNYRAYDYRTSFARIDAILAQPQGNYVEKDKLPDRDELTFTNGFYAYCSALFIDIRESSQLPAQYNRPALAKLYRAFISEVVAIFNSSTRAREVNIVGDCVWGVYNTPSKPDIDEVFQLAYTTNSLVRTLNYKLGQAGYKTPLRVGIGMAYGRALMIKAGSLGSGINDVVYMGDVVNEAAKLASQAGKSYAPPIFMQDVFYQNMNENNRSLLQRRGYSSIYSGDVVNMTMENWHQENLT